MCNINRFWLSLFVCVADRYKTVNTILNWINWSWSINSFQNPWRKSKEKLHLHRLWPPTQTHFLLAFFLWRAKLPLPTTMAITQYRLNCSMKGKSILLLPWDATSMPSKSRESSHAAPSCAVGRKIQRHSGVCCVPPSLISSLCWCYKTGGCSTGHWWQWTLGSVLLEALWMWMGLLSDL